MNDTSTLPRRSAATRPRRRVPLPIVLSLGAHALALVVGAFVYATAAPAPAAGAPQPLVAAFVEVLDPVQEDADAIEDGLELAEEPRLLDEVVVLPAPAVDEPAAEWALPEACDVSELQRAPLTLPEIPLQAARSRRPPPAVTAPPETPPAVAAAPRSRTAAAPAQPRRPRARLALTHRPDVRRYYPEEARRRGIQGTTLVRIAVDARGRVTSAQVERTSGSGLLDRHALRYARDLRFDAGAGGAALQPVTFTLR